MTPPRQVEVLAASPDWPRAFQKESTSLRGALGTVCVALHHIGSTAVPGLAAKPTIDMLCEATTLEDCAANDARLAILGYVARGASGIPGRLFYRKSIGAQRTHHLHVYAVGSDHIARHLAFRDYLATHTDIAQAYGALKTELAARHPNDIVAYMDGKKDLVDEIQRKALHAWPSPRS